MWCSGHLSNFLFKLNEPLLQKLILTLQLIDSVVLRVDCGLLLNASCSFLFEHFIQMLDSCVQHFLLFLMTEMCLIRDFTLFREVILLTYILLNRLNSVFNLRNFSSGDINFRKERGCPLRKKLSRWGYLSFLRDCFILVLIKLLHCRVGVLR